MDANEFQNPKFSSAFAELWDGIAIANPDRFSEKFEPLDSVSKILSMQQARPQAGEEAYPYPVLQAWASL